MIKMLLLYNLLGSIVYLCADYYGKNFQLEDEMPFEIALFFTISEFIFYPIIRFIEILECVKILIVTNKTISYINREYNRTLKDKTLTKQERDDLIEKRDSYISMLRGGDNLE